MGSLEFMNQDGEWEKFPPQEQIDAMKELLHKINDTPPSLEPLILG